MNQQSLRDEFEKAVDELEQAIREDAFIGNQENLLRLRAARSRLLELWQASEAEIKARGEVYGRMCDRLQACCQKYHLGLGGEHVDELVVAEVERLRASEAELDGLEVSLDDLTVELDQLKREREAVASELGVTPDQDLRLPVRVIVGAATTYEAEVERLRASVLTEEEAYTFLPSDQRITVPEPAGLHWPNIPDRGAIYESALAKLRRLAGETANG